jgi:hypothetical protein
MTKLADKVVFGEDVNGDMFSQYLELFSNNYDEWNSEAEKAS